MRIGEKIYERTMGTVKITYGLFVTLQRLYMEKGHMQYRKVLGENKNDILFLKHNPNKVGLLCSSSSVAAHSGGICLTSIINKQTSELLKSVQHTLELSPGLPQSLT